MRRFSQRNSLVTLSDLNVTPLIDLAFVLLIIFMITTPLLEQGLSLDLPDGGQPDRALKKEDIRTVEVDKAGGYMLDGEKMSLEQIEQKLVDGHRNNPNLLVYVRADHAGSYGSVVAVLNRCKQNQRRRLSGDLLGKRLMAVVIGGKQPAATSCGQERLLLPLHFMHLENQLLT